MRVCFEIEKFIASVMVVASALLRPHYIASKTMTDFNVEADRGSV